MPKVFLCCPAPSHLPPSTPSSLDCPFSPSLPLCLFAVSLMPAPSPFSWKPCSEHLQTSPCPLLHLGGNWTRATSGKASLHVIRGHLGLSACSDSAGWSLHQGRCFHSTLTLPSILGTFLACLGHFPDFLASSNPPAVLATSAVLWWLAQLWQRWSSPPHPWQALDAVQSLASWPPCPQKWQQTPAQPAPVWPDCLHCPQKAGCQEAGHHRPHQGWKRQVVCFRPPGPSGSGGWAVPGTASYK